MSAAFVVTSSDGLAQLSVPAGALPDGTSASQVSLVSNEGVTATAPIEVRFSYHLAPDGLVLRQPATFSMPWPFQVNETSIIRHDSNVGECPLVDHERVSAGELSIPISHFSDLTGLVDQEALLDAAVIQNVEIITPPPEPLLAGSTATFTVRLTVPRTGSVPIFMGLESGDPPSQMTWSLAGTPLHTAMGVDWIGREANNATLGLDEGRGEGSTPFYRLYSDAGTMPEYNMTLTCSDAGTYEAKFLIVVDLLGESVSADGTRTLTPIRAQRVVSFTGTCVTTILECPGVVDPECRSVEQCPFGKTCDDELCVCQCSRIHGAQCESAFDCGSGPVCNSSCMCECSVAAGSGCATDADCGTSTCDLTTCECRPAPACAPTDPTLGTYHALNTLLEANALAFCGALQAVSIVRLVHSALSVPAHAVAHDHTTINWFSAYLYALLQAQVDALFNFSLFDCGAGPNGYTLCSDMRASAVPPGDFVVLAAVVEGDIPVADPTNHYQYGFVFDADGVTTNNYQPAPAYPNDFFKDTDRWYQANYQPSTGWSLVVNTAVGGTVVTVASDARVIFRDNVILLVVPATELGESMPNFRVTAFRHTGDYGIPAPYDYDGSVWPAVADGLAAFP